MGISWIELGKAWRAAGGDQLFSGLSKKELTQLKGNIQGSDLEDLGGDLTKYISNLSESFNATTAAQRNIFVTNRNAHMFSGISEDKLNSIHNANEARVLRSIINPEGPRFTQKEADSQVKIEEASQKGINTHLTGKQENVGASGNTAAAREEAELRKGNSPEAQKLQQIFRTREIGEQQFQKYQNVRSQQQTVNGATAAAANVESSGVSKATQEIYDKMAYDDAIKQFFNDPRAKGIAKEYNIEENKDGMKRVLNIVRGVENAGPVQKMFATGGQKPLNVGSETPLQKGTLSYAYDPEKVSDIEKMSSISDLGFSHVDKDNHMKVAAREFSVDEAKLRSLIKQNDMPGTKAANDMLYGKVKKGLESQHASIMKSNLSEAEKIKKWDTAREEAIERLRNGATFQDYFFGNRVHHGLAGMAAITGTLGVAFGGHKSNAELYSSPF